MQITAIAAVAKNGVIGAHGDLPWNLPEDWRRFMKVTMGGTLIMGRKSFDSLGKPLPGRVSIVISHHPEAAAADRQRSHGEILAPGTKVLWVSSLDEALAAADPNRPIFIAGGGEVYRMAWDKTTALDITEVHATPAGDTFFPPIDPGIWEEVSRDPREGFDFVQYRRR